MVNSRHTLVSRVCVFHQINNGRSGCDRPRVTNRKPKTMLLLFLLLLFGLKQKPPFSLRPLRVCVGTVGARTPPPPRVLIVCVTRTFSFLGAVTRRVREGRDRHDVIFSIDVLRKRGNNIFTIPNGQKNIHKFQFHITV